jgi:hypothetical protein
MNGIGFVYYPLAGGFMFVNRRMVSGIMDRRTSYCRTTYLVLFFNWNFFLEFTPSTLAFFSILLYNVRSS